MYSETKEIPKQFVAGYFLPGFPSVEESIHIMEKVVQNGLHVLELGYPSGNPYLDGDVIRRAHHTARGNLSSCNEYVEFLRTLRDRVSVPVWIMGYKADLLADDCLATLAGSGFVDGFVIPDLTVAEIEMIKKQLQRDDVALIPVVNDEMDEATLTSIVSGCDVVYCQLYTGKTGAAEIDLEDIPNLHEHMKKVTDAKLMAGFGIKSADNVADIFAAGFDGVVIGSEFMRLVTEAEFTELYPFIHKISKRK